MRDLKELTSMVEKLCKKGQAYRAKRMRAGEKSSAYLSGRAVKVCKGQMQGESADPDNDDITIDPDTNFKIDLNVDEFGAKRSNNDDLENRRCALFFQ